MKKLSLIALAALLCSGLALTACKGGVKPADDAYIAKTIFELIPKEDLPDYCAHVQQTDYSDYDPADVPEFDPTFFAANVEGHMVEGMDSGFYGYINLKCYPLKDGGWRAYWASYGGYDGLCGFDRSGAYNYVNGKLTKEEFWLLPTPPVDEILSADLRDELDMAGEYEQLSYPHPNYSYSFGSGEDGVLSVNLDVDYLFYPEEGSDAAYSGSTYDIDYGWNGARLVRQDFDDLDDVQMRAIALMLGCDLEEVVETYHGFDGDDVNIRLYAEYDELGFPSSWKVFCYAADSRELKAYDFDGYDLKPTEHMIVSDWNALKAENETAGVWMSTEAIRFFGEGEDGFDFPLGGYTYDSSCDGLFEPDDLFEE